MLKPWLCILVFVLMLGTAGRIEQADAAVWYYTDASYYTLYGNRTACGDVMSSRSYHVAILGGSVGNCRRRVTICKRARCVRVRIRDRGAYHPGRRWDLTPRVRDTLHCGDVCRVRYHFGW